MGATQSWRPPSGVARFGSSQRMRVASDMGRLTDQFRGDRSGTFTDPYGYRWTIATHKEDLTPEELQRRQDDWMKQFPESPARRRGLRPTGRARRPRRTNPAALPRPALPDATSSLRSAPVAPIMRR